MNGNGEVEPCDDTCQPSSPVTLIYSHMRGKAATIWLGFLKEFFISCADWKRWEIMFSYFPSWISQTLNECLISSPLLMNELIILAAQIAGNSISTPSTYRTAVFESFQRRRNMAFVLRASVLFCYCRVDNSWPLFSASVYKIGALNLAWCYKIKQRPGRLH